MHNCELYAHQSARELGKPATLIQKVLDAPSVRHILALQREEQFLH